MSTPFDTLTREQALQLLADQRIGGSGAALKANADYYAGDHWQNGAGWTGPRPAVTDTDALTVLADIRKAFVSKNVVKEIVNRHSDGVLGREPNWALTPRRPLADDEAPTPEEQVLIDEAEAALTAWWDAREALMVVQEALLRALRADGRAFLRVYVPPGDLDEQGQVPVGTLSESLERIWLHAPETGQAAMKTDQRTMQRAGVYAYEEDHIQQIELTYVDEVDQTVVRILRGGEDAASEQVALPIGGRLILYELRVDPLVTEQVRQNQALLNMARTMMGRNVVLAGFLERIILNGQMPGRYEEDTATGLKRFIPAPFRVGAGTTNFIAGTAYTDEDGKTHVASPSVVYRDPVPVTTFEDTEQSAYRAILEEAHQLHALISGDAVASGESRKQARADFETSLQQSASRVQAAGRWLIETVLSMSAFFSGQPGRYDSLRAVFEVRIDAGPLSADELREISDRVDKKLLSRETAMSLQGVEDTDAEMQRIESETERFTPPTMSAIELQNKEMQEEDAE